ncbi:hypothetical protein OPQ81_011611 [Rhizoctonia solani]|nr:hypothetical protein OPQ81_011611 [Rhizoctonia solani]
MHSVKAPGPLDTQSAQCASEPPSRQSGRWADSGHIYNGILHKRTLVDFNLRTVIFASINVRTNYYRSITYINNGPCLKM